MRDTSRVRAEKALPGLVRKLSFLAREMEALLPDLDGERHAMLARIVLELDFSYIGDFRGSGGCGRAASAVLYAGQMNWICLTLYGASLPGTSWKGMAEESYAGLKALRRVHIPP